jgi:GH43 family beta-xylosidase
MRLVSVIAVAALAACSAETTDGATLVPTSSTPPPTEAPRDMDASAETTPAMPAHGLRSDWFDLFAEKTATRFDVAAAIAHDAETSPAAGVRGILYSTRFSGHLTVPEAGELTLFTRSDDGIRVLVDDKPVVDDWTEHAAKDASGTIDVTAGEHALRVEYFQKRGDAVLALEWQPPNGTRGPIPIEALRPATTAPEDAPRPTFDNPVVSFDCPDPGVVSAPTGGHPRWMMVCTGGPMKVRASDDLVTWADTGGALLPGGKAAWSANGGRNWAPEIHRVGSDWVAYYTAVNGADRLSIGCAYAPKPEGPYTDCGAPLVQHPQGVIDANFFEDDDGKRYLYYKIDGNSVGQPTPIFVRELAPNGRSFAAGSAQVQVLTNDPATWEGGVVEATWVVKRDGMYFMFYSGNVYDDRYRTGVARAKSPKGPFTKKGAPILGNNSKWVGPGHGTVLSVNGKDLFFHHAWPALANGKHDTSKGRYGLVAPITWKDGWPVLGTGSSVTTPMAWP